VTQASRVIVLSMIFDDEDHVVVYKLFSFHCM